MFEPVASLRGRSKAIQRVVALAVVTVLCLAVASGPAAKAGYISFSGLPSTVYEGQKTTIKVYVRPASPLCVLTIRYTGGRTDRRQQAAPKGNASWTLRVPNVPPGTATVTVTCKGAGTVRDTMLVQWALQAPLLSVGQTGWSQRNLPLSTGSLVSYGLVLRNERARFDAIYVTVLVNFVDAENRVLGSSRRTLVRVPASFTVYVGGLQSLPTQTPVARLETVVGPAKSAQRVASAPPLISDVVIAPDRAGTYVDSVRGQLLNAYQSPMRSADIGIVLLDSAGNIVGGGFTHALGPISNGARVFFSAAFTFRPIPVGNATSALVSAVPTYIVPR